MTGNSGDRINGSSSSGRQMPQIEALNGNGTPDKRMLYVFTGVYGSMPLDFQPSLADEFDAQFSKIEDDELITELLNDQNDVVLARFFNTVVARQRALRLARTGNAALMVINVNTPIDIIQQRLEDTTRRTSINTGGKKEFKPLDPNDLKYTINRITPASIDEGIHYVIDLAGEAGTMALLDCVEFGLGELGLLE